MLSAQKNESAIHIQISPSLLDFPPIQVTIVHQVELSVLYSMFPSVVCFMHNINNVYVSIPVSQFLPRDFDYCVHFVIYTCNQCLALQQMQIILKFSFKTVLWITRTARFISMKGSMMTLKDTFIIRYPLGHLQ